MLAFALAVVLHVGAEAMGLEIGWFSYYMLLLACCFLLPLLGGRSLATVFTWPARWLVRQAREWERESRRPSCVSVPGSRSAARALLAHGRPLLDLPGAIRGVRGRRRGAARRHAAVCAAARARDPRLYARRRSRSRGMAMWLGDRRQPRALGLLPLPRRRPARAAASSEAALAAYERGERYAPPGQSRRDKIEELKRKLDSGAER